MKGCRYVGLRRWKVNKGEVESEDMQYGMGVMTFTRIQQGFDCRN